MLLLPQAVLGSGPLGIALGAIVAAGAWATFLATSSGLIVSIAGVIAPDVRLRRGVGVPVGAVIGGAVPLFVSQVVMRDGVRRGGRAGVRAGRVDVLPAARARHLVAGAHPPGAVAGLATGWSSSRATASTLCLGGYEGPGLSACSWTGPRS